MMDTLIWEPGYHSKYDMHYQEAEITDLVDPDSELDVASVTVRKYPRKYTFAVELWAGEDYTHDGDGDGMICHTIGKVVYRNDHAYVEKNWGSILNTIRANLSF